MLKKGIPPTNDPPWEDLSHGQYRYFPIEWFGNKWNKDLGVERPTFQRVPALARINEIKEAMLKEKSINGEIIQTGILTLVIMNGKRYIIDGQHRLEAYRQLQEPYHIWAQFFLVTSEQQMLEKFKEINSHVPIEKYIIDPNVERKGAYDTLILYVEKEYSLYIRSPNNTGKNNFPNISTQTFRHMLPYIEELKNSDGTTVIKDFETYNQKCREALVKNKKTQESVSRIEVAVRDKKNQKVLYINHDLMKLWSKHGHECV